ncbi:MAG: hypothetical protein ACSLFI_09090 [Solirubrobacterales bacterium]
MGDLPSPAERAHGVAMVACCRPRDYTYRPLQLGLIAFIALLFMRETPLGSKSGIERTLEET